MKNILIFLLLNGFIACQSAKQETTIANIPEDEMIAIMVDLAVSDAMVDHELLPTNKLIYQKKLTFYASIFEKHGYTYDEFEEAFLIYSQDLVHLSEMYDEVLEELSKKEIELKSDV